MFQVSQWLPSMGRRSCDEMHRGVGLRGHRGLLQLQSVSRSVTGRNRSHNEDAVYAPHVGHTVLIADGMGGAPGGGDASRIATSSIPRELDALLAGNALVPLSVREMFHRSANAAADAMIVWSRQFPDKRRMGTTYAIASVIEDVVYTTHLGDCRIYYLPRHGRCKRLTKDQTFVQDLIDSGLITEDRARRHELRHVVMKRLGAEQMEIDQFDCGAVVPHEGDRLVLVSDGIWGSVPDESIYKICSSDSTLEDAADELVLAAMANGALDDATCIVAEVVKK
ncbi:MAG: protein phosphatase 2C domain-containing protein [Pirellulaceae bacterium]|nr:serine/threonine-protein phosphatase [Planctomycetales bacterium]